MNTPSSENCIVTVAFREPYVSHHRAQIKAIKKLMDVDVISFIDQLPYHGGIYVRNIVRMFQKSVYGFKPHAIQTAVEKGYKKIVWLDPSILPTASPQLLFDSLDNYPMLVRTGKNEVNEMTNDEAIKWFRFERSELVGVRHIGGTIYGFNMNDERASSAFTLWKLAEKNGMFGTQVDFMAGHWADESCLSLAMVKTGIVQHWESKFTYTNQKEK